MDSLLAQWASLVGFAALIAIVINVLKLTGVVKDGTAQTWSAGLNLVGLVGLFILRVVKPDLDVGELDKQVGAFSQVAVVMIGYISQLLASKLTHVAVKNIPLIGASHTLDK